MSSIFVGRTRARSQAIQLLFQADVQGVDVFDLLERGDFALDDDPADADAFARGERKVEAYAETLAKGVAKNRLGIDRLLTAVSHNWNLSRMPLVDRCVMAVAIYEMFGQDDVPTSVSISEAVEISKVYGTDDSSSFVNGVLGRVARLAAEHPEAAISQLADFADPNAPAIVPPQDRTSVPEGAEPAPEQAVEASEQA